MRKLIIIVMLFGFTVPAWADENQFIDCSVGDSQTIVADNVYKDVYDKAQAVCLSMKDILILDPPLREQDLNLNLQRSLAAFGAYAAQALKRDFGASTAITLHKNAEEMEKQLASTNLATGKIPMFEIGKTITGKQGFFTTGEADKFDFPDNHDDCNKVNNANKNCVQVFEDFKVAFNVYRKAYDQVVISSNKQLLDSLNRDWDRFLDISKSQTGLEVWLTTLWHSKHFKKDRIVGPPSSQIIALHPQLVYEYVDGAVDGDNAEFGVAVEWLGINFWNKKMPFGFSVASVYTDRVSVADIRTGVMLHLDNKYSIGWGYRDGENSVYFSLDLLTLFQSKRQQYDRYIQQYQGYLE